MRFFSTLCGSLSHSQTEAAVIEREAGDSGLQTPRNGTATSVLIARQIDRFLDTWQPEDEEDDFTSRCGRMFETPEVQDAGVAPENGGVFVLSPLAHAASKRGFDFSREP